MASKYFSAIIISGLLVIAIGITAHHIDNGTESWAKVFIPVWILFAVSAIFIIYCIFDVVSEEDQDKRSFLVAAGFYAFVVWGGLLGFFIMLTKNLDGEYDPPLRYVRVSVPLIICVGSIIPATIFYSRWENQHSYYINT